MNNFWLKLRIWTKTIIFVVVLVYVLMFFWKNNSDVKIWYWPFKTEYSGSTWFVMLCVFVAGGLSALLIRTTFKTLRQMRELKTRNKQTRMERELADMKTKAAMLQTRPTTAPAGTMVIDSATSSPPPGDASNI